MNTSIISVARLLRLVSLCTAFIAVMSTSLFATTLTVNTTTDTLTGVGTASVAAYNASATRSLRGAIIAVNNDVIPGHTINIPAGTYTLTIANATATTEEDLCATGDLDVRKAVSIVGVGSATTIIQAGTSATNGIDKILSINPLGSQTGFACSITGVTLRFGRNQVVNPFPGNNFGGAMDFDAGITGSGSLTMNNVRFEQNSTTNGDGGALALFDGGTATLTNCVFDTNTSTSNSASQASGGGISIGDTAGLATTVTLNSCSITNNKTAITTGGTPGVGGGINSFPALATTSLILHGCTVTNNLVGFGATGTSLDGGGIRASTLTIDQGSVITGNTATRWGGGVFIVSGTSSILASTIKTNTAGNGFGAGGVFVNSGATTLTNSRVVGNTSTAGASALATNTANAGITFNAANNWFGANAPAASLFGTGVTSSPNLVLRVTASPSSVVVGQTTSTATATLTFNSSSVGGFSVPGGTPVSFSSVLGTMGTTSTTLTSGSASSVFTPTSGGSASASATVDAQTVSAAITVTAPPAITSGNAATFRVGVAGSFTVTATGTPAPTFSYTGTLPSGVTLSAAGLLSGTPAVGTGAATYPITITASNGVSPAATQAFTLTVLSPMEYWKQVNFGANATNPLIAGDAADPDGDGLSNLMEYALGLSPTTYTLSNVVVDFPSGYLRLTTPKVATASDLSYVVEVSSDLVTWDTINTTITINTATQLRANDLVALPRRFIRLKITKL